MTWEKSCWVCKGGCVGLRIDFSGGGGGVGYRLGEDKSK